MNLYAVSQIMGGSFMARLKGFFQKAGAFIKGKLVPVVKKVLDVTAAVVPGPINLILHKVSHAVRAIEAGVSASAVANSAALASV